MNRVSHILAMAKNIFIAIALLGTLPSYGQDGCWEDRFLEGNEGRDEVKIVCRLLESYWAMAAGRLGKVPRMKLASTFGLRLSLA